MKKILILSDTHGCFDAFIEKQARWADEIWHAGDWGGIEVADQLQAIKPLRGVYGNIDDHVVRSVYNESLSFEVDGLRVSMLHIAGYPGRYNAKAKALIAETKPHLFICGHSHILKVMKDQKGDHLHINPGAAGLKGFHKVRTMIRMVINEGKAEQMEVVEGKR
jgi:putative phosphoesterase